MSKPFDLLAQRVREAHALDKVLELLEWDQLVTMPPGGGRMRAEHCSVIKSSSHAILSADETGRLIDAAAREIDETADTDPAALLRWARREWTRKRSLPTQLVSEMTRHTSQSQEIWAEARAKNDFASFKPALQKMVELKKRVAEARAPKGDLYDAWLEEFEPGMTTAEVAQILGDLERGLVPLARAVAGRADAVDDSVLNKPFDVAAQKTFCLEVAGAMGFDFERGRLDTSAHPFTMNTSRDDVRLTTRYRVDRPMSALFGTMHEAGHGLYEQGVDAALDGTPLAAGATMAVHESQSRLWENQVGRSREFWTRWLPRFKELFPQVSACNLESIYRAVNKSGPSLIRVEADELTYSLHILLRFNLERELLAGRLAVADLPEAWNAGMKAIVGIAPPDDARGVLQDTHWASGLFGYFPTYAIGNIIAAQLWEAANAARPSLPKDIAAGRMAPLLEWLRHNVHRHGKKYFAQETVQRATGRKIEAAAYLKYLSAKYGEIYGLSPATASR